MNKRVYLITRDLHLSLGLFIAPFVLVFAVSVFFLVHAWVPGAGNESVTAASTVVPRLPPNLDQLSGRQLIDALGPVLRQIGVQGEVGFVRHLVKDHALIIPVTVPGRETTVKLDLPTGAAEITRRTPGIWNALIVLHKSPGPHLAAIRMNWAVMGIWRWLADSTVYLLLFISASGVYLWLALRAERRAGLLLMVAGAFSFFGLVYALSR